MSAQRNAPEHPGSSMIDVAFLTALPLERDAVLRHLEAWKIVQDDFEPLTYYRGHLRIPETGERYEVVLVLLLGMGNEEAAIGTVKVIKRWQPAALLLVGIAGGIRGKVTLGDVIIADFVYYYEHAKQMPQAQQRRALHFPTDRLLYGRALAYEANEWRQDATHIQAGVSQEDLLLSRAHFGAIGSGEKVIADAETVADFLEECPRLVAFAMEGAGVARAAAQQPHPPAFLEIRGICDYADEQKNDAWQLFAAETASTFAIGLLRSRPFPPLRQRKHSWASSEQPSLLVLCAQSLRLIPPVEIRNALRQHQKRFPVMEHLALDWTDLVVGGRLTDPEQAIQRLMNPQGVFSQTLKRRGEAAIAFHGLVHIPLAFLLGHLMTDGLAVILFDFHPADATWSWSKRNESIPPLETSSTMGDPIEQRTLQKSAVVRLSVSYTITPEQTQVVQHSSLALDLAVPQPQRHVVGSEEHIRVYGRVFRQALDHLAQQYPALERIHLFYAGPVALAFHLGQQISASIHPPVTVWNFQRGYDWGIDLTAASLGQPCVVYAHTVPQGVTS